MAELINQMLGIRYPIIQGGMAWVATWELASAVSNAGGLGIIGVGGADVNWVAEQLGIEAAEVMAESNFKDDLNADSLDLFEMIMAMEEEFGVEIPSDDLDQIATVQDVMDYLKNKGVEE